MYLYTSADGVRLERAMLACVRACQGDPKRDFEPVLILVPTRRLADHVKRRMVEEFGAVLGVHVLTHRALATRALEFALQVPPYVLREAAKLEILSTLCEGEEGDRRLGSLGTGAAAGLRQHPGARRSALAAFGELRDAGVESAGLGQIEAARPIAELYHDYADVLSRLGTRGFTDAAGFIQAALPHVVSYLQAKQIRKVVHHGAYELTGVHLDLLRACESASTDDELHYFLPGRSSGAAYAISARFIEILERRFTVERRQVDAVRPTWEERLDELHNPECTWSGPAADAPELEIWHAQGTESELRLAALRALALHQKEGVPFDRISIVARSLERYAPYLQSTFEEVGLPFVSSATQPLRRTPGVAAFLQLLRVLARGFDRQPFIDLARSGIVEYRLPDGRLRGYEGAADYWERWSRSHRVARGLDAWRRLPGLRRDASALRRHEPEPRERYALESLEWILDKLGTYHEQWSQISASTEHVAFLRVLLSEASPVVRGERGDLLARIGQLIDDLEMLVRARREVSGADATWTMRDVEALFERLVAERTVDVDSGCSERLQVVDLMQARGMVRDVVVWIGFQHGVFPATPRGNPVLEDTVRSEIVTATGRPLYARDDRALEERLLLATTLGAVATRLVLVFQRADDEGKKLARSSAFREVARLFTGRADATGLLADDDGNPFRPFRLPAHPAERGAWMARQSLLGLVPSRDALLSATVGEGGGVTAARACLAALDLMSPRVEAALSVVEKLEDFDPRDMSHDGMTGEGVSDEHLFSPSQIEQLGRCPLSFFLGRVLGLQSLEDEPRPERALRNDLGTAVHDCLSEVYARLPSGRVPDATTESEAFEKLYGELVEVLDETWPRYWQEAFGPSATEFAGLLDTVGKRWRDAVEEFLREDLGRLSGKTIREIERESEIHATLDLGQLTPVHLRGRMDRHFVLDEKNVCIDDYKTSGDLKKRLSPSEVYRGNNSQLPLYREMVAGKRKVPLASVTARLLGVGPDRVEESADLKLKDDQRLSFLETLAVPVALAREGHFPAYEDSVACRYCEFRRGCRKNHVPTARRFQKREELADYRDSKSKGKDRLTLADIRSNATESKPEDA